MLEKLEKIKILDKYILKQIVETFLISLVIFTSIIFATNAFLTIVRQITNYGIPLQVAAMLVMLKLPSMLILTIPMGILLSTILTVNKMNNSLEITILKACGVGVNRISRPILICAIIASLVGFTINEVIAPAASQQAKTLTIWAIMKRHVPNGKKNVILKDSSNGYLTRFFHIASVKDDSLHNITVLDLSRQNTIQVIYAKTGTTATDGWLLNNGVVYTISTNGKILNTAVFNNINFDNTSEAAKKLTEVDETELNYFQLRKHISNEQRNIENKIALEEKQLFPGMEFNKEERRETLKKELAWFQVVMNEKFAMPFTSIVFALIAIPLAITGPRARFNRGLLFSIAVLFIFYILRALSTSIGETGLINPILAAWLPNIILFIIGYALYYQKAYKI